MPAENFHGLIQHSFALQVPPELRPIYTRRGVTDTEGRLRSLFETADFKLGAAGMEKVGREDDGAWDYSLLVSGGQTQIAPLRLPFKEPRLGKEPRQPSAFAWAGENDGQEIWEGFVLGDARNERPFSARNDFLIEDRGAPTSADRDQGLDTSRFLAQLLANKRSHLFGLALGRSGFNILLPHAVLTPEPTEVNGKPREDPRPRGEWFVQPVLSLFNIYARRAFRPIFSFSLFMAPVTRARADGPMCDRTMPTVEIHEVVKTQWPLATAFSDPVNRPKYIVDGPLVRYLAQAGEFSLAALDLATEKDHLFGLSLREFTEATLFSLAGVMAGGPRAQLGERSRKLLGDRIVTSLSASRVTSVAVVDECLDGPECYSLAVTLAHLAAKIASPIKSDQNALREHRLDKPLFDREGYVSAVIPDDRCLITVGAKRVQMGLRTSLLLEAGWTAYQVIGAATATGLIRGIFREITVSERSEPDVIADIEGEAMVELHETYDIEIVVEAHRKHYSLLRQYLGIDAEYDALGEKLRALHRETGTRADGRSERRLAILTWAIVVLSALILVGTLALIIKPGG